MLAAKSLDPGSIPFCSADGRMGEIEHVEDGTGTKDGVGKGPPLIQCASLKSGLNTFTMVPGYR